MSFHVRGSICSEIALFTLQTLLAILFVHFHVTGQVLLGIVLFATNQALVQVGIGVKSHVLVEFSSLSEFSRTNLAIYFLFVNLFMFAQFAFAFESFAAHQALVRSLITMNISHVSLKALLAEKFVAFVAFFHINSPHMVLQES
jgi:hypothetical protein